MIQEANYQGFYTLLLAEGEDFLRQDLLRQLLADILLGIFFVFQYLLI